MANGLYYEPHAILATCHFSHMPLTITHTSLRIRRNSRSTYTLAELMVIVVILGILAGLSVPLFVRSIEKSYNKQVPALMKMMLEAEKMRRLKTGDFVACNGSDDCSAQLRLPLPADNLRYSTTDTPVWTVRAERLPQGRVFTLSFDPSTSTDQKPLCSGGDFCP